MICLLIQPIHPAGVDLLRKAGIELRQASAATMDVVAREIEPVDAAITRNAGLNKAAMQAAPRLRVLGNHGIGVDPVDVGCATEIGLPVVFTPYANVRSVAELAIAQMLAIAKRVREADKATREGRFDYRYSRDFRELTGKTLAIIGFGRIGRLTAQIAKAAFDMRIVVYSPSVPEKDVRAAGFDAGRDLDVVLADADVVSLHQTLTPRTKGMFDRDRLFRMKKGATLVNTARGGLVDTDGLVEAVTSGYLRGAAMDVFDSEPLPVGHPFTVTDGIVLSPHIGGATEEAMERTALQTAQQVIDVLEGRRPEYLVNPDVWGRRRK
jgi:D-3-phosphoglycerate dehydrogenase